MPKNDGDLGWPKNWDVVSTHVVGNQTNHSYSQQYRVPGIKMALSKSVIHRYTMLYPEIAMQFGKVMMELRYLIPKVSNLCLMVADTHV